MAVPVSEDEPALMLGSQVCRRVGANLVVEGGGQGYVKLLASERDDIATDYSDMPEWTEQHLHDKQVSLSMLLWLSASAARRPNNVARGFDNVVTCRVFLLVCFLVDEWGRRASGVASFNQLVAGQPNTTKRPRRDPALRWHIAKKKRITLRQMWTEDDDRTITRGTTCHEEMTRRYHKKVKDRFSDMRPGPHPTPNTCTQIEQNPRPKIKCRTPSPE